MEYVASNAVEPNQRTSSVSLSGPAEVPSAEWNVTCPEAIRKYPTDWTIKDKFSHPIRREHAGYLLDVVGGVKGDQAVL